MAKYSAIKAAVNAYIKQNGRKEITGRILNAVLNATIDSLGRFYQFAGEALPTYDPGIPDQNVTYLAGTAGTYTNFGGITLDTQEMALLMWDGEWKKQTLLFGIKEVEASVDNQVGTPSVDVDFVNNVLTLAFHNIKGDKGDTGDAAGFGQVTASVDDTIGNPSVQVQTSGDNTSKNIAFEFHGLRGETGITSVVVSVDNTTGDPACSVSLQGQVLHLDFSGLKGLKGDTGVSADYPITIYNGLDSDATDQALAAAQGKVLAGRIRLLQDKVDGGTRDQEYTPTTQMGYYYTRAQGNVLTITANSGSSYTGTIADASTPPSDGVDISAYVGKTLRIYNSGSSTSSSRCAVILNENNIVLAIAPENSYSQDADGYWVYDLIIPADAKWFFWSGVRTFVKVVILDAEQTTGLIERVSALEEETGSMAQSVSALEEAVNANSDEIDDINKDLDGFVGDKDVTPGESTGFYYTVSQNRMVSITTHGSSHYTGIVTEAGTGITPTGGVDVSPYVGKTLRFRSEDKFTGSARASFIVDENGVALAWVEERNLSEDSDGYYADLVVPEGGKYFYYSGVYPIVSVTILDVDEKGIKEVVSELVSDVQEIKGFLGLESASLKVVLAYPKATISEGENEVVVATDYQEARMEDAGKTIYDSNPLFNFYSMRYNGVTIDSQLKDDIAPAHFLGQTLGANHGQPCKKATITGHGLTNTAIGTGWEQNGVMFYVMLIPDADHILFLSENLGTINAPRWTFLQTGTLTSGGNTLIVESVSDAQILPSIKNESLKIRIDGKEVSDDGEYYGNVVDFVESYEVMNPSSLLDNIIARAGEPSDPVYTGDGAARIENIYRFVRGMNIIVISNFAPKQQVSFQDLMFNQAMQKGTNGQVKYYIPNSLPFGDFDFRQPLTMTWGSDVSNMFCTSEQTKDTNKPINRVIQYAGGLGYAIGFLIDRGVGKSLFDYTHATFELRGGTGKIYPHGVDSVAIGTTLQNGQVYGVVMYRCPFIPEASGNRLSMYHFKYEGSEYVFLDYKGTMTDRVVLDDSLDGREISVLESQNAALLTDVYNGGFYVHATYVANETCYLVAKIR